jgi:hypothetical protein
MRSLRLTLLCAAVLLAAACGGSSTATGDGGTPEDATPADDLLVAGDTGPADDGAAACDPADPPALDPGWIGGPCQTAADCSYADAVCLTDADGFPGGLCTLACDRLCPDQTGAGMTTTFCVDGAGPLAGTGMCVAQCDFAQSPATGCRACWGCDPTARYNEAATVKNTCTPGAGTVTPPSDPCYDEARARGLTFTPLVMPDEHPADHPELTCHITAPMRLTPPIHGVHYYYKEGGDGWTAETPMIVGCELALALDDASAQLAQKGVVAVQHWGTYNCRVVAGTATLSEHASALAIDFVGFKTGDGTTYTLLDDFEGNVSYSASNCRFNYTPQTAKGQWLLDVAYGWCDAQVFNTILTPNYNTAHADHFHCDMKPGSHFLGVLGGGLAPVPGGE